MEEVMPIIDVFVLATIVFAFAVFGIVLTWGEYQTRRLRPPVQTAEIGARENGSTTTLRSKTGRVRELVES